MNCTDINEKLDDYLDNELSEGSKQSFEQHVNTCEDCRKRVSSAQKLLAGLQQLPLPPTSPGFEQRVFSEVRRQHTRHSADHDFFKFASGFATAAVAGLAIWFVSTVYQPAQLPEVVHEQSQIINVALNQPRTVRLVFDAEQDFEQVRLSIDLPGNMELDGYPGRHQLTWKTHLQKGQNVLALPIQALQQGQGELIAQLNYGDKEKIFKVLLTSTLDGVLRYPLNDIKSV